ncbi:MAG: dUTP diphosphatase [Actinomycetia bacterium]|nr:dUTP diphosphatase [Actinomycetes bacterium]
MKLKIETLDKTSKSPGYARIGDAGLDLYSAVDCILRPYERRKVPTGIKVAIPEGYAGFVQPKSGLAIKSGLSLVNTPGLIDSGYRGEVCAILINLDPEEDFIIKRGDKICQLVIQRVENVEIEFTDKLDDTSRGEGGFGSTG